MAGETGTGKMILVGSPAPAVPEAAAATSGYEGPVDRLPHGVETGPVRIPSPAELVKARPQPKPVGGGTEPGQGKADSCCGGSGGGYALPEEVRRGRQDISPDEKAGWESAAGMAKPPKSDPPDAA